MRILAALLTGLLLTACGSSPSPVLPPVELTPIQEPLRVETRWKGTLGYGVYDNYLKLKPIFSDNIGYGVDYYGHVVAFDPRSGNSISKGNTIWKKDLGLPLSTGPVLIEGRLYLGSSQGNLIALDPKDGRELWRTEVSSEILAQPAGEEGIIVVRSVDGRVTGLNAATGTRRWVFDRSVPLLSLRGTSAPVVSEGIVLVGADNGKLSAMTLLDGTVLWEALVAEPQGRSELERMIDIDATPVVIDGVIYVVTFQGKLATIQLENGQVLWSRDISSYNGIALDGTRVYLTDSESHIWALNRFNGATIWRQDNLLRRSVTAPVLQGDHLIVGDYNGFVHWLRRDDGQIVARKRVQEGWYMFNYEDKPDLIEGDKRSPNDNNILVAPLSEDNLIVAVDRRGNIGAYTLIPSSD